MSLVLCLLLCIQPFFIPDIFCSASCTELKFNNVQDETITVDEHSVVNFTFNVANHCADSNLIDFEITVGKTHGSQKVFCRIRHTDKCRAYGEVCKCPENSSNVYQLTKRVDRKDTGTWTWIVQTLGIKDQFSLAFNIRYLPNVTGLKLLVEDEPIDSPVKQGDPVTISCLWDSGNPPHVQPQLAGRHGNLTADVTSVGLISHTILSAQCDDAGTYFCKDQHLNVAQKTLLVKCKPKFPEASPPLQFNGTSGQDLVLDFPVRTHSTVIKSCEISTVWDISAGRQDHIICRNERLMGSAPDLTLTVTIKRVSTHIGGLHTLTLTNDDGSGHVDFVLNIEGDEQTTGSPQMTALIGVGVSILVVLAVCNTLFVVCRIRKIIKGRTNSLPLPPTPHTFRRGAPDAVMFHVQPAGQNHRDSFISVLGHDYEEIRDGPETAAVEDDRTAALSSSSSERSIDAGIVLRIANPSPNMNMSDDPDEVVLPAPETMTTIATVHAVTSGDGATATSTPGAKCEPPYENTMNPTTFQDNLAFGGCRRSTGSPHGYKKDSSLPRENLDPLAFTKRQPSNRDPPNDNVISIPLTHKQIKSKLLPADNLHFIVSTQEQKQDAKLPDENLKAIILPQDQVNRGQLSDDYMHPPAATLEQTQGTELPAETAEHIASSKEEVKQSKLPDDYLHPIASLAEHMKHRNVSKVTQQKEKEAKLPAENVRPIAGSQKQEKYSQLPDDYLNPIAALTEQIK